MAPNTTEGKRRAKKSAAEDLERAEKTVAKDRLRIEKTEAEDHQRQERQEAENWQPSGAAAAEQWEREEQEPVAPLSADDRLSRMESSIASLVDGMSIIGDAVSGLQKASGKLPRTQAPERRIAEINERTIAKQAAESPNNVANGRRMVDLRQPQAHLSGFQPDDVVRLSESCEKRDTMPDGIQGVVLSYLGTRKGGQRKYKCLFPGVGKDGFLERELELVGA